MSLHAAEVVGYLLHRLMHSGWIRWLGSSHMKHHMVLCGPLQKQRPSEHYLDATTGELALGNIGSEWIIPSCAILAVSVAAPHPFRVPLIDQVVSIGTTLLWSFQMFSYLHDRLHVKNFWMERMERTPVLRRWFIETTRVDPQIRQTGCHSWPSPLTITVYLRCYLLLCFGSFRKHIDSEGISRHAIQ